MKRAFLLSGILLFIIGSVVVLGAYFFLNQYSASGVHLFRAEGPAQAGQTWQMPEEPFELNEGDKLTVRISVIDGGSVSVFIKGTGGKQSQIGSAIDSNMTVYYYAQTNDLYFCSVVAQDYVHTAPYVTKDMTVTLNIEVVRNAPNLLFLVMGVIVLLAGAVTVPTAVLYRSKNGK